jgi:hypothetical protein
MRKRSRKDKDSFATEEANIVPKVSTNSGFTDSRIAEAPARKRSKKNSSDFIIRRIRKRTTQQYCC